MWNECLLDYWSVLVLKYTAALLNAFGPSLSWCCFAQLMWNSTARVNFGDPAHPTALVPPVRKTACAALVPAAPHPWGNSISKAIQCASALTFIGILWLLCLEHIILMGGNQINSKPHLTSASCEDSGSSVCCIPGSPNHANLLASNTCHGQWKSRNQCHLILLCYNMLFHNRFDFHKVRNLTKKNCNTLPTTPAHTDTDGLSTYLH